MSGLHLWLHGKSGYYEMVVDLRLPTLSLMSQIHVGSFNKVQFGVAAVVADVHVEEKSGAVECSLKPAFLSLNIRATAFGTLGHRRLVRIFIGWHRFKWLQCFSWCLELGRFRFLVLFCPSFRFCFVFSRLLEALFSPVS